MSARGRASQSAHASLLGVLVQADVILGVHLLFVLDRKGGDLALAQAAQRLRDPVLHQIPSCITAIVHRDIELVFPGICQLVCGQRHFDFGASQRVRSRIRIVANSLRGIALNARNSKHARGVPCLVVFIGVAIAIGGVLQVVITAALLLVVVDGLVVDVDVEVTAFEGLCELIRSHAVGRRLNQVFVQLCGIQHDAEALDGGQLPRGLIRAIGLFFKLQLDRLGSGGVDARQSAGVGVAVVQVERHDILRRKRVVGVFALEHGPRPRGALRIVQLCHLLHKSRARIRTGSNRQEDGGYDGAQGLDGTSALSRPHFRRPPPLKCSDSRSQPYLLPLYVCTRSCAGNRICKNLYSGRMITLYKFGYLNTGSTGRRPSFNIKSAKR